MESATRPELTELRAKQSAGTSSAPIYDMAVRAIDAAGAAGGTVLDVGCGTGTLRRALGGRFSRYVGVDVIRHEGLPSDTEFHRADLDTGRVGLPDGVANVVASVETIEHVENPRSFVRELVRLTRPGGWVVITTPNNQSLASKVYFLFTNQHLHFQERPGAYPAHITALLEIDLIRIARECGLSSASIRFSGSGRVPKTGGHRWPRFLRRETGRRGRAFSDNVLMVAQKS